MKSPGFGFTSSFVSKACKIFKLNKNAETANQGFKDMSFKDDVYQDLCKPAREHEQGFSWRNTFSKWQRSAPTESAGEVKSPRTSVRTYGHPWGRDIHTGHAISSVENEEKKIYNEEEGILTLELIKPRNGYLGLVLVGGSDTPLKRHYVNDILPDSSASKADRVRIGDEILEVNGHSLTDRTHSDALMIFRSLPTVIKLVVERKADGNSSLLASLRSTIHTSHPDPSDGDPNITSPKMRSRKRGIVERARDVVPTTDSQVIDVMKSPNPFVKPAKLVRRVSRCSSFVTERMEDVDEGDEYISMRDGDAETASCVDYDDSLSFISDTSEWCAQQLKTTLQSHRSTRPRDSDTISLKSLAESLPGPPNETVPREDDDSVSCRSPFSRAGSLRLPRSPPLYEDQEFDAYAAQDQTEPAVILRKGSLRVRGSLSLRRCSVIDNQEGPATWPATIRRQRTSLNWDTFVPPPPPSQCFLRRSSSAVSSRPSSVYSNVKPSRQPRVSGTQPGNNDSTGNKVQRTNSDRRLIEKRTIAAQVFRDRKTGEWGFTIAGGVCSPYGDLPIHVLEVRNPELAGYGLLKKGDEIIDFNGDNFEDITFLEAEKVMHGYEGASARVIIKRKYIEHRKVPTVSSFGSVWCAHARGAKVPRARPESFYY